MRGAACAQRRRRKPNRVFRHPVKPARVKRKKQREGGAEGGAHRVSLACRRTRSRRPCGESNPADRPPSLKGGRSGPTQGQEKRERRRERAKRAEQRVEGGHRPRGAEEMLVRGERLCYGAQVGGSRVRAGWSGGGERLRQWAQTGAARRKARRGQARPQERLTGGARRIVRIRTGRGAPRGGELYSRPRASLARSASR